MTANATIDLNPGAWSTFMALPVASTGHAPGNIAMALQDPNNPTETTSLIENAKGGGNDYLTGNSINNVLTGNGGNDQFRGGGDVDTAVFSGSRSNYSITNTSISHWTEHQDARGGAPDGRDWVMDDVEWLQFTDGAYSYAHFRAGDTTSIVTTGNISATHDTLVSLAPLITLDGATAKKYNLWMADPGAQLVFNGFRRTTGRTPTSTLPICRPCNYIQASTAPQRFGCALSTVRCGARGTATL